MRTQNLVSKLTRMWSPSLDDTVCIFCCTRARSRLFHPCMHVCACDECALKLDSCPVCKKEIHARWKVYLS